jgi:hypothetical protein
MTILPLSSSSLLYIPTEVVVDCFVINDRILRVNSTYSITAAFQTCGSLLIGLNIYCKKLFTDTGRLPDHQQCCSNFGVGCPFDGTPK